MQLSLTPEPHQIEAISKSKTYFSKKTNRNGKLIMACGTGKTLTSYWLTQELKPKRVVMVVPNLNLESQSLKVWIKNKTDEHIDYKFMCVCSDQTVTVIDDLKHANIPVTTNVAEVKDWLQQHRNEYIVILVTYQSVDVLGEASKEINFDFDFGLIDEAHRSVGDKDKMFSSILFDKNIKISQRLYMTATPKFYLGNDDKIVCMDDENIFGKEIYHLSTREAIQREILCPYQIYTLFSHEEEVIKYIKDNPSIVDHKYGLSEAEELQIIAAAIATIKGFNEVNIIKAISYHSKISRAQTFGSIISKIAPMMGVHGLDVYHINGEDSSSKRRETFDKFDKSKRAIITNSQTLTEGVDVPELDAVIFADPRHSNVSIVQAAGRPLRYPKHLRGKKTAKIVIPSFVAVNTETGAIEEDSYKDIRSVVSALGLADSAIAAYYEEKGDGSDDKKKRKERSPIINYINCDDIQIDDIVNTVELKLYSSVKSMTDKKSYEKASKWCVSKKITGKTQFEKLVANKKLPFDIPSNPRWYYKERGWVSWAHFLKIGEFFALRNVKKRKKIVKSHFKGVITVSDLKQLCKDRKITSSIVYEKMAKNGELPEGYTANPSHMFERKNGAKLKGNFSWSMIFDDKWEYASYQVFKKWCNENDVTGLTSYRQKYKTVVIILEDKPDTEIRLHSSPDSYYKEWYETGGWKGISPNAARVAKRRKPIEVI